MLLETKSEARAGVAFSVPFVRDSVHSFDASSHLVLTNAHGKYIALLCRDTAALVRLGKQVQA